MPVPGYGGTRHGLVGVSGGIWVVLGAWGAGVSLAMVVVLVHWWGSHQSRLSIPWGCRATALPASSQTHSAAMQPIQPKTPQLNLQAGDTAQNLQAGDTAQNRAMMARGEGKQTPKREQTPPMNTWFLVPEGTWHTTNSSNPMLRAVRTPARARLRVTTQGPQQHPAPGQSGGRKPNTNPCKNPSLSIYFNHSIPILVIYGGCFIIRW